MRTYKHKVYIKGFYGHGGQIDACEELAFNLFGFPQGECKLWHYPWYEGYQACATIDYDAWVKFIAGITKSCCDNGWSISDEERKEWNNEVFLCEHSHVGVWQIHGFTKTGYDYGIQAFAFANEEEAAYFILNVDSELLTTKERY